MAGFCGSNSTYTDQPKQFDNLYGKNAQNERRSIFGQMDAYNPSMQGAAQNYAQGLQRAATDSGWGEAQGLAKRTMAGQYLSGSPELQGQLDANYNRQMASAADSDARIRSNMARAGMNFSTANQQASQANKAAAAAQAGATNAQTIGQNFANERALQSQSPQMLAAAQSAPLSYLSQIPGAYMQPLMEQAQLVSGLASGAPVATPNSTIARQPGVADYLAAIAPSSIS